jgi:hypothetical protein
VALQSFSYYSLKRKKGNMSKKGEEKGQFDEWQGTFPGVIHGGHIGSYARVVLGFDVTKEEREIIEEDVVVVDTPTITNKTMILYKKTGKSGPNIEDVVRDAFKEYLGDEFSLYGINGVGGKLKMNCVKLTKKQFSDLKSHGIKSDCLKSLLALDTNTIAQWWNPEEGKEICQIANLASFVAGLIAAFGIPQSISPGARAWNNFPVLLALKEHESEHLYDTIFNQQCLLVCARIGAALLCNVEYDVARKLFIALGAALEQGISNVHLDWKKKNPQQFAKSHPSKIGWKLRGNDVITTGK